MGKSETLKKEKGTINSTQFSIDSVKNQDKDRKNDLVFKENSITLIDRIINNISRDQAYLVNENQIRQFEFYLRSLNQLKKAILIDPRFPYQIVQNQIDHLYRKSPAITVFNVALRKEELINQDIFNPVVYGV